MTVKATLISAIMVFVLKRVTPKIKQPEIFPIRIPDPDKISNTIGMFKTADYWINY